MHTRFSWKSIVAALTCIILALPAWAGGFPRGIHDALGDRFRQEPQAREAPRREPLAQESDSVARLRYWNEVALDANALDHTPVSTGEIRIFGEQIGPVRTSRALAIVHIAICDAVNAITHAGATYTGLHADAAENSMDAAIAQAAHDTLVALYPSQKATFDARLADDLNRVANGRTAKANGIALGKQAAAAILALRADDGSDYTEPRIGVDFIANKLAGKWRQDPVSLVPIALGAYWGSVKPFVIASADQFRSPPPPALDSPEYAKAFNEVKRLGGDGISTPTDRTADQTIAGIYWGYDGTPGLGTPPRLYNQIAIEIAKNRKTDVVATARLLALVNMAMADTGNALWATKYYYQLWRPITGIREADSGTGSSGAGDRNPATAGDAQFTPLGAPASNLNGPNFTPPFPAYPSGHAGFGSALFQILRDFYQTDKIAFTFISDEYNGVTRDHDGRVRPLLKRSFASLSAAEEENGQSRIYLGIHWAFDKTAGSAMGRRVAAQVYSHAFLPNAAP